VENQASILDTFQVAAKEIDDAQEVIKDLNKTPDQGDLTGSEQAEILKQLEELLFLIQVRRHSVALRAPD
jgi:hypothetical protein